MSLFDNCPVYMMYGDWVPLKFYISCGKSRYSKLSGLFSECLSMLGLGVLVVWWS